MKVFARILLVLAGSLLLAVPAAWAQTPPAKGAAKGAAADKKNEPKQMDFEGDVVEAQFMRPDQGIIGVVGPKVHSSLIKVRSDFVDEILKSAEDL